MKSVIGHLAKAKVTLGMIGLKIHVARSVPKCVLWEMRHG